MNKKLILGALAVVLSLGANPASAMDDDSVAGQIGHAWHSLKEFVLSNLGLGPDDVDPIAYVRKVDRPGTTTDLFAKATHVIEPVGEEQLSLVKGLFRSEDIDAGNPPPQYYALKLLQQDERIEGDIGLYVKLQKDIEGALTVSAIPYNFNDLAIVDLGEAGQEQIGELLLQLASPTNPNIKRLQLLDVAAP